MSNTIKIFALVAIGSISAVTFGHAQEPKTVLGVECARVQELGIDKQTNKRAGEIRVGCGLEPPGAPAAAQPPGPALAPAEEPLAPPANINVITGTETPPHVVQSESMVWSSNGQTIVVTYNDSREVASSPVIIGGVSVSTNGGASFTRLTPSPFRGHGNNFGDPMHVYNAKFSKWVAVFLATGCGGQGLGTWTSVDGLTWNLGPCAHTGANDDRESMWVDNNPTSPFYGNMYLSWNNFSVGSGAIFVIRSNDGGVTWSAPVQVTTNFIRNVQLTGGPDGTVFLATMNEGGGGFANRTNIMYRSTNGGVTFLAPVNMGPPFAPPGDALCSTNSYFAIINPIWRHMGWGQPGVGPGSVVHYAYAGRGTATGDTGDIFYVRSTDNGATWSPPLRLNTDAGTRTQWMPSLSVTASGDVQVYWYDRRNTTNGTNYQVFGRRSTNNGASWQADEAISNQLIPQPLQQDPNIQACFAGDYNYATAFGNTHYATWTDGRVSIAGNPQQDVFFAAVPTSSSCEAMAKLPDFNADARSDFPWRQNSGPVAVWLMNGASVIAAAGVGTASTDWRLVATGDLNGDGKSDFVWRHTSGAVAVWFMNGTTILSVAAIAGTGLEWTIVGAGDLNGDGKADIIFRHTSGAVAVWFMDGATLLSAAAIGAAGNDWRLVGIGDLNGDGKIDFVWRNESGPVAAWLMNGATITSAVEVGGAPADWRIVGVGDLNGDGRSDLVWRQASGAVAAWFMNGTAILSVTAIGSASTDWHVAAAGDLNGDGRSDINWRNDSGALAVWFMNGAAITSVAGIGTAPTDWQIVNGQHDPAVAGQCRG